MKNMIHIRNSVIIILCITVVLLGVGFIVLSVQLDRKNNEIYTMDVVFNSVKKTSSVKGSEKEPTSNADIISNGTELDMKFNLNSIHDEITYVTEIKNKGNLPCEIVDVMQSPDYNNPEFEKLISPISINISDVKGKIIPPKEKIDLKIVVYYNKRENVSINPKSFSYRLGLITKSR